MAAARRRSRASAATSGIKFRDLRLDTARDLGASALATGHYVRRVSGVPGGPELHRARDAAKDQSYFLYRTTRAELEFLRFPLGGLDKSETRALAHEFALPVAQKPDSQDICFVPQGSYAEIVARLRPEAGEPGDIIDERGALLGRHDGIAHFTVGQRKGIGIAAAEPLYVLRIEPERRRVVVGPKSALAETPPLARRRPIGLGTPAQGCRPRRRQAALGAKPGRRDLSSRHRRTDPRRARRRGRARPGGGALRRRPRPRRRLDPPRALTLGEALPISAACW